MAERRCAPSHAHTLNRTDYFTHPTIGSSKSQHLTLHEIRLWRKNLMNVFTQNTPKQTVDTQNSTFKKGIGLRTLRPQAAQDSYDSCLNGLLFSVTPYVLHVTITDEVKLLVLIVQLSSNVPAIQLGAPATAFALVVLAFWLGLLEVGAELWWRRLV